MPAVQQPQAKSLSQVIASYNRALTPGEIAEFLCIKRDTVYKAARAGDIPSFRIGTSVRFDPKAVSEWLERQ